MIFLIGWWIWMQKRKKKCQHLQCVGFIAIQIPYASFQATKQIISFYLSSRVLHTAYIRLSWHGVRIRINMCLSNRRIWRGDVQKVHASLTWSEFSLKKYNNFLCSQLCHKISFYCRLLQRPKTTYNCNILQMGEDNIFSLCFEQNMLYL